MPNYKTPNVKLYLLTVFGDVEAAKSGPFKTEAARTLAAKNVRHGWKGDENGVFRLDVRLSGGYFADVNVSDFGADEIGERDPESCPCNTCRVMGNRHVRP